MVVHQNSLWESFLSPLVTLLIDEKEVKRYQLSIDWEKESKKFFNSAVSIPRYYSSQNFHGIEGGYLNSNAAVSYDPITQFFFPPNETWVRQTLIDNIKAKPRRILDLGCGTGSTTLMLKQAFPQAEVIGWDLSPYMLVRAADKAKTAGLDIKWQHGNAENTGLGDATFDLVTASLLFHETPATASLAILQESLRLLVVGGQVLILDGNQKILRQVELLNNIFVEPYIQEYAAGSVDEDMRKVGFGDVKTQDIWLIHQITSGIKPIPTPEKKVTQSVPSAIDTTIDNNDWEGLGSPVFGIET